MNVRLGYITGGMARKICGAEYQSACEVEIWKGLQIWRRILRWHTGFTSDTYMVLLGLVALVAVVALCD